MRFPGRFGGCPYSPDPTPLIPLQWRYGLMLPLHTVVVDACFVAAGGPPGGKDEK